MGTCRPNELRVTPSGGGSSNSPRYIVHWVFGNWVASSAFRLRLFSILCCGVSAPVTGPPVTSRRGGLRPGRVVPYASATSSSGQPVFSFSTLPDGRNGAAVTSSVSLKGNLSAIISVRPPIISERFILESLSLSLLSTNLPSAPSSSGFCGVRFGLACLSGPHHLSPHSY
jgi:hypothetical protein